MISLEEQIKKQEETVLKVKEKYDSEMMKLKDLYAKRAIWVLLFQEVHDYDTIINRSVHKFFTKLLALTS